MSREYKKRFRFQDAVIFALACQIPILLFSMLATDFGVSAFYTSCTFLVFWVGVGVLYFRKRKKKNFTRYDLFMIRTGFFPVAILNYYLTQKVWEWQGII